MVKKAKVKRIKTAAKPASTIIGTCAEPKVKTDTVSVTFRSDPEWYESWTGDEQNFADTKSEQEILSKLAETKYDDLPRNGPYQGILRKGMRLKNKTNLEKTPEKIDIDNFEGRLNESINIDEFTKDLTIKVALSTIENIERKIAHVYRAKLKAERELFILERALKNVYKEIV